MVDTSKMLLKILVTIFVVRSPTTVAFVPNHRTTLKNSNRDSSSSSSSYASPSSSSSSSFLFDEGSIRYAYDEWRTIYEKGEFDQDRFKHFKTNHRTLITANMKARESAAGQGLPAPKWMSLNEYGDFSFEEFEQQQQQNNNDTQVLSGGDQTEEFQDEFGRPTQVIAEDAMKLATTGRNDISRGTRPIAGTQAIPTSDSGNSPVGTQVIQSNDESSSYGTQIIQQSSNINSDLPYGTQVIESSKSSATIGTQVVSQEDGALPSSIGTQTVSQQDDDSSTDSGFGTQVLKAMTFGSNLLSGTRVIQPMSSNQQQQQPSKAKGTIIISKKDGTTKSLSSDRGTLVVSKDDKETWTDFIDNLPLFGSAGTETGVLDDNVTIGSRGTMVIKRQFTQPKKRNEQFNFLNNERENGSENKVGSSRPVATQRVPSTEIFDSSVAKTTTKSNGIFSFFGGKLNSVNSRSVRTTISLQPKSDTKIDDYKAVPNKKSRRKTELVPKKEDENGLPSILSFFGGSTKATEKNKLSLQPQNTRSTLTVNKPLDMKNKTQIWSPFLPKKQKESSANTEESSSTMAKNDAIKARIDKQRKRFAMAATNKKEAEEARKTKREEQQRKKLEASRNNFASRTSKMNQEQRKKSQTFFGGGISSKGNFPKVKKWKQNRDGSITGLIYDSKSFKDGTKVTTSPVPKGARKGSTVMTSGGTSYQLM